MAFRSDDVKRCGVASRAECLSCAEPGEAGTGDHNPAKPHGQATIRIAWVGHKRAAFSTLARSSAGGSVR